MIIHGGGWILHTNTIMEGMARYITNRGYVVFNVNYRVRPEASLEQIVEDCLGALLWIKEHAPEYKGDPARLAVTGDSAGGHLTAMIVTQGQNPAFHPTYPGKGTADTAISCAIPTYGVYDFVALDKIAGFFYLEDVFDARYKDAPERYRLLSPYYHIRPGLAPQLVIVGTSDFLFWENLKYVRALKKAGAPVELWVYPGMPHAFLNDYWKKHGQRGYDRMVEFLDQELKGK
jgi:acetyl esterase/lipase